MCAGAIIGGQGDTATLVLDHVRGLSLHVTSLAMAPTLAVVLLAPVYAQLAWIHLVIRWWGWFKPR
jgi:hypothetical protein